MKDSFGFHNNSVIASSFQIIIINKICSVRIYSESHRALDLLQKLHAVDEYVPNVFRRIKKNANRFRCDDKTIDLHAMCVFILNDREIAHTK